MPGTPNKVRYGLKKVHYAVITESAGTITYGTPAALPGAVSLSIEPRGETTDFYADDMNYYTTSTNDGYEGTLEIAEITEAFRKDVLGELLETADKVLEEVATAQPKKIALLFEFNGDVKATRHALYYCTVTRPSVASETTTASAEPKTSELSFVAAPRPNDYKVKVSTSAETTTTVYDAWYTSVYKKV